MFVVHGALTIERAHLVVSTLPAKHSWSEKKDTEGSELLPNIDKNAFIILAVKIRNDVSHYIEIERKCLRYAHRAKDSAEKTALICAINA
ncbi:hypothetical protein T07_13693 [Trichinella nelsoni]|uniref:Uncharacterized protein n=1 Tax=Trichinella nelsoni TaxID=6336 RepID=A0A0V0S5S3_9BILA|nr:hypothetical protein T07_13693 [Trichinella nelsoni]